MALTIGTNCGFVETAPTADPAATNVVRDTYSIAIEDTSPAGAAKVTEIGWWCDNATEETNYEVAIYADNSTDTEPEEIIGVSRTNAKGTAAGWIKVTGLDIAISASTKYWIAVQIDDTVTGTNINYDTGTPNNYAYHSGQTTLPDPWGTSGAKGSTYAMAIYAVYSTTGVPVAAFSGTPLIIDENDTVTFTDATTGTPTSWAWTFGDGDAGDSTLQNPTHKYLSQGYYTVSLTATNAEGSDDEVKASYIQVDYPHPSISGSLGTKDMRKDYPYTEGLIARTTKQTKVPYLEEQGLN